MSTSETLPPVISKQRKRFEALGIAINKASSIRGWLKVLFATTLIFGLPSIALLSDPLKDSVSTIYQVIIFGSRVLIIALAFFLISRLTTAMYTAKNDMKMKLEETGYKVPKTNTVEEKKLVKNNIVYSFIKITALVGSALGLFLLSSRDNYAYILGHQIIYAVLVFCLLLTFKFWSSKGPNNSPRLGGRMISLVLMPALLIWGFEVILDFFSNLTEPRFHYNILQISWGIIYPFMFVFLLVAVLITSKKTKRERMVLQEARFAEFKRRESFISDKGRFSRLRFIIQVNWNKITQFFTRKEKKKQNLDKKPNIILVNSIWIAMFLTFLPFGFMLPWNLFPQDGILIIISLMIAYQYSMTKYERQDVDVIAEPDRNENIAPPEIRTNSLMSTTFRLVLLPTIIFIITQYLMAAVIAKGDLSASNMMLTIGFTWIAVLLVIPISIQLIYHLNTNTIKNREEDNVRMFRFGILILLMIELVLLAGSVAVKYVGVILSFDLMPSFAIILQSIFIVTLVVIPLLYLYIIPKLDDNSYQILRISTYTLIAIINAGILALFITNILGFFGILAFPF